MPLALRMDATSGHASGTLCAPPAGLLCQVKSSVWPERIVRVSCSLPQVFDAIFTVYLIGPSLATSDSTLMPGVACAADTARPNTTAALAEITRPCSDQQNWIKPERSIMRKGPRFAAVTRV